MSEHHEQHGVRGTFWWGVFFVALPVLYLLGFGPMIWLVTTLDPNGDTILSDVYATVYYPVEWIYVSLGEPLWLAAYGAWWHNH